MNPISRQSIQYFQNISLIKNVPVMVDHQSCRDSQGSYSDYHEVSYFLAIQPIVAGTLSALSGTKWGQAG